MSIKVGEVEALFRYPVKSMGGEILDGADMGWHGLDGDRRLALRRLDDQNGFPWLTASKLPELILFSPTPRAANDAGPLPTHVRTPEGESLEVFSQELATDVGRRHGVPVEMVHLNRGIFDEASISVITSPRSARSAHCRASLPTPDASGRTSWLRHRSLSRLEKTTGLGVSFRSENQAVPPSTSPTTTSDARW
jgi:hypothetical protein